MYVLFGSSYLEFTTCSYQIFYFFDNFEIHSEILHYVICICSFVLY